MLLIHLIYLLLLIITYCSFDEQPTLSFIGNEAVQASSLKISPDEGMIVAGFVDGNIKIFDVKANQICAMSSTLMSPIVQLIWAPSYGPISLDANGVAISWSAQCQSHIQYVLNGSAVRISWVQYPNSSDPNITDAFIGFNLQNKIEQYNTETGDFNLVYEPQQFELFIELIYSSDGTTLFASTNTSFVRIFSREDGSQTEFSFQTSSPVRRMAKVEGINGQAVFGITQTNQIYRFYGGGNSNNLGTIKQSNAIALCPTTKQIALADSLNKNIGIYIFSGHWQQSLGGLNGYPQQLDCSTTYLMSVDDTGYINIYTYAPFKSWIGAILAGVGGGLIVLVIAVIVVLRLRRKWAEEAQKGEARNKRPRKYSRSNNATKIQSMQIINNSTLMTTMR